MSRSQRKILLALIVAWVGTALARTFCEEIANRYFRQDPEETVAESTMGEK